MTKLENYDYLDTETPVSLEVYYEVTKATNENENEVDIDTEENADVIYQTKKVERHSLVDYDKEKFFVTYYNPAIIDELGQETGQFGQHVEGSCYMATDTQYTASSGTQNTFVANVIAYTIPSGLIYNGVTFKNHHVKKYTFGGNSSSTDEELYAITLPKLKALILANGITKYSLLNKLPVIEDIYFCDTIEQIGDNVFSSNVIPNPAKLVLHMSRKLFNRLALIYPSRVVVSPTAKFDNIAVTFTDDSN